jgi:hypothetical protein
MGHSPQTVNAATSDHGLTALRFKFSPRNGSDPPTMVPHQDNTNSFPMHSLAVKVDTVTEEYDDVGFVGQLEGNSALGRA